MIKLKHLSLAFFLSLLSAAALMAQSPVKVSGVITSSDDALPLIGAAVLDASGNGVIADMDGRYEIVAVPGTELIFSCFGYQDVRKAVPAGGGVLDVVMDPENLKLEDAVVIAYGVRKKGTVAGSVSTVKSDKLKDTLNSANFQKFLRKSVIS